NGIMDKVENFEIELDISQQNAVYDYVRMDEIQKRADQEWDMSSFRGRGTTSGISKENENDLIRIKMMDNSIMDTRFLEKKVKVKEDSSDTGSTGSDDLIFGNIDEEREGMFLPRRLLPVYHPGDTVRGHVDLHLNSEVPADALQVAFVGQVTMNIRMYHQHGYYDDTRHEEFVKEKTILWEKASDKDTAPADTFSLLGVSSGEPQRSRVLPAGKHRFSFEFHIPSDAPPTVPPLYISTTNYAHLVWRLKAKIVTGSFFKCKNITTHRGILLRTDLDIATNPENLTSISTEEELDTGLLWNSGKITCKATVGQAGHIRGEPVNLTLELNNSSGGNINRVEAFVRCHGKARLSESKLSCSLKINLKTTKVIMEDIKSNSYEVFRRTIPWDFKESSADGNLLPVGHLEESKMLDVNYEVTIKIKRKGLHRNFELCVPLEIGTVNSAVSAEAFDT
ncbi:hypothetical protein CAPTEDRAFT_207944, partial [Capitella teleta]